MYVYSVASPLRIAMHTTPDKVQEQFEQASEHFREYLSKSLSECVISQPQRLRTVILLQHFNQCTNHKKLWNN